MIFNEKLDNLSNMYNVSFFQEEVKDVEYIELATEDILHKLDLIHINNILKEEGYSLDCIEAFNDTLAITYFKK